MGITYATNAIKVSELFCDKLSFTIDYHHSAEHQHIASEVKGLGKLGVPYRKAPYKNGVKVYEGEYPSKMMMVIQWQPIHSGVSYLRVDYNPAHADMELVFGVLHSILPGGIDDYWLRATFTRFDAAVDIQGILPHQLAAYYPKKTVTQVHSKSGRIETLYLGAAEGGDRVVIYDKGLQIKEKNHKYNLHLPMPKAPTTRVEIRMKPQVQAGGLAAAENPFANLVLRRLSLLPKQGPESWRLFVAVAQLRGAQDALMLLDDGTRKLFKLKVNGVSCTWWKPNEIWLSWEELLGKVLMLPGNAGLPMAA